ncbi:MAG: hypothetical protein ACYCY9_03195 [Thiobacillus sp.]
MARPVLGLLLTSAMAVITTAMAGQLPMPPGFTVQSDPETVLRAYPLGAITKQAAFSHHGKAIRTVILPNGKEGWVYEVGIKEGRTYEHPTKQKHTVHETEPSYGVRTYTLEFDSKGVVIDVLYNEQGRHDGLTALQVQRRIRGAVPGRH